jgi:hypothetical protein
MLAPLRPTQVAGRVALLRLAAAQLCWCLIVDVVPCEHPTDDDTEAEGGEAACMLHELCPDCGAVPDAGSTTCWRCGRAR